MNTAYAKVFESLFDGSLRGKSDPILVFVNILTHTRKGIADIHFKKISDETGVPIERVKAACLVLEAPDPDSRTPDEEGRRIIRLDGHRNWGWRVVNAEKYRDLGATGWREDRRTGGTTKPGYVYYALCESKEKIKIGFSANPWARIKELDGDYEGVVLIAMEKGTYATETERHTQFSKFWVEREWFRFEGELKDYVVKLRSPVVSTTAVPASASVLQGNRGPGKGDLKGGVVVTPQEFPETGIVIWDWVLKWLQSVKDGGADYTENETRQAWLALKANGWMWGKNPVTDWRAALECKIQDNRSRKPANGKTSKEDLFKEFGTAEQSEARRKAELEEIARLSNKQRKSP